MNKTAKLWLVFVLLLVFLAPSAAHADVVTDWNAIASQTAIPVRPGPSAVLDMAIVHAAMHDAIQAFEGRFQSYSGSIPNASGSPVAAAATLRMTYSRPASRSRQEPSTPFSTTTSRTSGSWETRAWP